nr:hypothetical protein [Burkholderia metallica]
MGEALAQELAVRSGVEFDQSTTQADLLFRIEREIHLDKMVRDLFHTLRIEGNKATHQFSTKHREAMDGLKVARALAIWFHQSFGKRGAAFKPGPFVSLRLLLQRQTVPQAACRAERHLVPRPPRTVESGICTDGLSHARRVGRLLRRGQGGSDCNPSKAHHRDIRQARLHVLVSRGCGGRLAHRP